MYMNNVNHVTTGRKISCIFMKQQGENSRKSDKIKMINDLACCSQHSFFSDFIPLKVFFSIFPFVSLPTPTFIIMFYLH